MQEKIFVLSKKNPRCDEKNILYARVNGKSLTHVLKVGHKKILSVL